MNPSTTVSLSADVVAELDVSDLWSHSFPSASMVGAAAALLTPLPSPFAAGVDGRRYATTEGPRARLVIGPGCVQVGRTDPARAERAAARVQRAARAAADVSASDVLLEHRLEDADSAGRALSILAAGGLAGWDDVESAGAWADHLSTRIERRDSPVPASTSKITAWSSKSRANMVKTLAQLDYAPLFEGVGIPAMLTLTYPGDWLTVAPSPAACKSHLDALRKRFQRAYGRPLVGVWKREFQHRGAPHYHFLMVPPHEVVNGQNFREWISRTWADVVGHPDPVQRLNHTLAGVGVDYAEGTKARDPKRLAVYFSKHGAYGAKEYQNRAPEEWTDAGSVGRFWGVWGLDKAVSTVEVSPVEALAAARTMRRWQRANGYRVQTTVWRTDTRTGVQRKRRSGVWSGARMRGSAGFIVVNDGASFVSTLARHLDAVRTDAQDAEISAWLDSPARLMRLDRP